MTLLGLFLFAPVAPSAVALAPASDEAATLDLFVQEGSIVAPGETVTVRVSLRAGEGQSLGQQAIRLSLTEEPLATESQLRRFLNRESDVPLQVIEVQLSPEVLEQETSDVRIQLTVPEWADPIIGGGGDSEPSSPAAIWGLQADYIESIDAPDGKSLLSQRQALIAIPSTLRVTPAQIAPIVPIIVPATGGRTLSSEELENYTASGGVLDRVLGIIQRYPATVAVDSRITLSVEALGSEAPGEAVAWKERIDGFTPSVIFLPWADADPLATLAIDTLLYARLGQYPWLHSGVTVAQLEDLAQRSADAILVSSSTVDSDRTVVQHQSAKMIRVDDDMSEYVREAALAASVDEAEAALQRAQALVARRALSESGETLVFHTGRLPVTASVIRLEDILGRLFSLELAQIAPVPLSEPASELALSINEAPQGRDWSRFVTQVRQLWEEEVSYVSIADNPEDAILGRWNRYQALFSSSWRGNPSGLEAEWGRAQADSEQFRRSVRIEEGSAFTVLSDRTELPVVLRNDLRSTVRLQLVVQPQRAIVSVETPTIDVVIPAESSLRVGIPVRSLANGTVPVSLQLQSMAGEIISDPVDLQVTIRAGWENVITGGLALAIGIVFAVGIYRAVQRRRTESLPDEDPIVSDG